MKNMIGKSVVISLFFASLAYLARIFFSTQDFITDLGGISVFASIFGTLFGILTAFIVVEVWSQYNKTTQLIEDEANGLEKLFRLSLFFRDEKFTGNMKNAIVNYIQNIVKDNFKSLGAGGRNTESGILFRKISHVVKDVSFDDDHDQVVFSQILVTYDQLSSSRTERIAQSLARLPFLLKFYLYVCILIAILTLVFLPFQSIALSLATTAFISFMLVMVLFVIEDLDNPFVGSWNLTTESYERVLKHIEEDYKE